MFGSMLPSWAAELVDYGTDSVGELVDTATSSASSSSSAASQWAAGLLDEVYGVASSAADTLTAPAVILDSASELVAETRTTVIVAGAIGLGLLGLYLWSQK